MLNSTYVARLSAKAGRAKVAALATSALAILATLPAQAAIVVVFDDFDGGFASFASTVAAGSGVQSDRILLDGESGNPADFGDFTISRNNGNAVLVDGAYRLSGSNPSRQTTGGVISIDPDGPNSTPRADPLDYKAGGVTLTFDNPINALGFEVGDWATCCQPSGLYIQFGNNAPIQVGNSTTFGDQFLTNGGAGVFVAAFDDTDDFTTVSFWGDGVGEFLVFGGTIRYSLIQIGSLSGDWWDGDAAGNADNGVVNGGNGRWTATSTNFTGSDGAVNGTFGQGGTAIFAGTAGTVTVDDVAGPISVSGLDFRTSGYTLNPDSAANRIALSGTNATISVEDAALANPAAATARVNVPLTGTASLTKAGAGTLTLGGASSYSGGTVVSAGTLIGSATSFGSGAITNNAALVIDQPTTASFANPINGTGTLAKRGVGMLTLTGTSGLTGATTVEAGRLNVNGQLAGSAVTVLSGATLGGTGRVGSITTQSGSFLAPGGTGAMNIGTLSTTGNYSALGQSTYQVELASTGAGDRVAVGGSAAISTGAILNVARVDAGKYLIGQRYTVVTTGTGRTGTYTLTGNTRVSNFINIVANYDSRNVYLDTAKTRRFSAAAATSNQFETAEGLETAPDDLFHAIAYLQGNDTEAQAIFDQLSGELHSSVRGAALEDSRFIREAAIDRLVDPAGNRDIWLRAYGSAGVFDGDEPDSLEIDRDIWGVFLGADFYNNGGLRAGAIFGWGQSDIELPGRFSKAETNDLHAGLYLGYDMGSLGLRAGGAYMWRDVETDRSVGWPGFSAALPGYSAELSGGYDIGVWQFFGELGYKLAFDAFFIEPFGRVAYVGVNAGAGGETGGSAALFIKDDTYEALITYLGGRTGFEIPTGDNGSLTIRAEAAWKRNHDDGPLPTVVAFSGGDAFTVTGIPLEKDVLSISGGISAALSDQLEIGASYSGEMLNGVSDHGGRVDIRFTF